MSYRVSMTYRKLLLRDLCPQSSSQIQTDLNLLRGIPQKVHRRVKQRIVLQTVGLFCWFSSKCIATVACDSKHNRGSVRGMERSAYSCSTCGISPTVEQFKTLLKTELFRTAYPDWIWRRSQHFRFAVRLRRSINVDWLIDWNWFTEVSYMYVSSYYHWSMNLFICTSCVRYSIFNFLACYYISALHCNCYTLCDTKSVTVCLRVHMRPALLLLCMCTTKFCTCCVFFLWLLYCSFVWCCAYCIIQWQKTRSSYWV